MSVSTKASTWNLSLEELACCKVAEASSESTLQLSLRETQL